MHRVGDDLCKRGSQSANEGHGASEGEADLGNSITGLGGSSGRVSTGRTRGTNNGSGSTWIGAYANRSGL